MLILLTTGHRQQVTELPTLNEKEAINLSFILAKAPNLRKVKYPLFHKHLDQVVQVRDS